MTETPRRQRARRGTGSVFERPSGWYCQWSSRDPATGARKLHKKGAFKSEGAARKYLTAQLAKVNDGTFVAAPRPKPVREVLDAWLATKTDVRPTTLGAYRVAVECWLSPRIGGTKIAALTEQQVRDLALDLAAAGGRAGGPLSPRSCQLALLTLRQAINYAIDQGWAVKNVAAKVKVRRVAVQMRSWNQAQARTFLASARNDRLSTLFALAVTRGLRRGELAGLMWHNVDLDAGNLAVVRTIVLVDGNPHVSEPKTNAGRRKVPLDSTLVDLLRSHRKRQLEERLAAGTGWTDSGHVFTDEVGEPLHPDHISNRWEGLVRAAGVPRIRLHDARHTAATLMIANGTPVKVVAELLGHADPRVTLTIYQHVLPGMTADAAAGLTRLVL